MTRKYFPFCFYVLVSVLCLGKPVKAYPAGSLNATSETDSITPLKIGDKIPDELWDYAFPVASPHADQVQYLTLGDFRDKLIILDFWATWCAPCISSLHKLDTLQQEFAGDLLVFPTSYEAQDKVRKFFADKGWRLPTAFDETHLKKYFPHRIIPHQVWLKDGEVLAITGSGETNRSNIEMILAGNALDIDRKWENMEFDPDKPLFIKGNGSEGDELNYVSLFSDYIEGVDNGAIDIKSKSIAITNHSALHLYQLAFENVLPLFTSAYNRFRVEVSDSLMQELVFPENATNQEQKKWKSRNSFCYNLFMPREVGVNKMREYMTEDLNRYFGIHYGIKGSIEMRKVKCWVIEETSSSRTKKMLLDLNDSNSEPFDKFHRKLAYANRKLPQPIISKVKGDIRVPQGIDLKLENTNALREVLEIYGLTISEEIVEIEMIVLSES